MVRPTIGLFCALFLGLALDACGARNDAAADVRVGDAQFEADYRDDYESDTFEDQAEAAEEATLDLVDDLDDIESIDTSAMLAPEPHTAGLPKGRRIHGALSIVMDNAYLMYADDATLTTRFREVRTLGADVVRIFVSWRDSELKEHDPLSPTRPSFDASNPSQYDWTQLDKFFDGVKFATGRNVLLTLGGPIPWWASDEPEHCANRNPGPNEAPKDSCAWKPNAKEFAMWVTALGRHLVETKRVPWGVTLWNEPNMSWFLSDDGGTVDPKDNRIAVGLRYRKLWFVGRKALRSTAHLTTRVLFADMANGMTTPAHWTTLLYSMCLADPEDPAGKRPPCVADPRKVYTAGVAFHPYSDTPDFLMKSVQKLEQLVDRAADANKISKGRYVYLTEHGFRAVGLVPPAPASLGGPAKVVTPEEQAQYLNVLDHDVFADTRIRSVANFLIEDEGDGKWDCGFIFNDVVDSTDARIGEHKPAYQAYQTSIDVVTVDASTVQVFGLARSCKYGAVVEAYTPVDSAWHEVLALPVDELGYGQKSFSSAGRTKWRLRCGVDLYSREVAAR